MVDFDVQCGVTLVDGKPCTRPITCRLHSMYAKTTVSGRSADVLTLLRNYYQRIDQRLLGPAGSGRTSLEVEMQRLFSDQQAIVVEETILDADKDMDVLLETVKQRTPAPLAYTSFTCVKRRTSSLRMRDLMLAVLNNQRIKEFGSPMAAMHVMKGSLLGIAGSGVADETMMDVTDKASDVMTAVTSPTMTAVVEIPGKKAAKRPRKKSVATTDGDPMSPVGAPKTKAPRKKKEPGSSARSRKRPGSVVADPTATPTMPATSSDLLFYPQP